MQTEEMSYQLIKDLGLEDDFKFIIMPVHNFMLIHGYYTKIPRDLFAKLFAFAYSEGAEAMKRKMEKK